MHMGKLIPLLGDQFVSCAKQGLSGACAEAFPANNLGFHLLLAHPRSTGAIGVMQRIKKFRQVGSFSRNMH